MNVLLAALANGGHGSEVHLFQNTYVPDHLAVVGDFVECTWPGYVALPLPAATDSGISLGGQDVRMFAPLAFGPSSTAAMQMVYGYWVDFVDPVTLVRTIWFAQKFDVPLGITAIGQIVQFILSLGCSQGP